jgi:glycosyltransferase involved in cell wall biosynthesis
MAQSSEYFPGISVVTPTHGRDDLVQNLLQTLYQARIDADTLAAEVLIIDSSHQEQAHTIQAACLRFDARYIHHPNNNVREKRNIGIEQANYPIILFIDSDCRALPRFLLEHARPYAAGAHVGGVIGVTRFVGDDSWIWRVIEKTSLLDAFSYAEHHAHVPWGPTCNISFRKDVIAEVGVFDTRFPFRLGGDDTDLGLRVTAANYQIVCNPNAIVEHTRATWSKPDLIARRSFRWGRMHYHLMQKHPTRVFFDFPTVPGIVIGFLLLLLPVCLLTSRPGLILLPLVWVGLTLVIELLLTNWWLKRDWKELPYLAGARIIGLIFEIGTVFESGLHGSFLPLYKEISYTPPSLQGRNRRIFQLWAAILALLMLVIPGYI